MGIERVKIELLGTTFSIQSDEDPEYIRSMLSYVDEKISQVRKSVHSTDNVKISILTSLLLCDELFKQRLQVPTPPPGLSEDEEQEVQEITQRLIQTLEQAIINTPD